MSKQSDLLKSVIDAAIQKGGFFKDAQTVVVVHETLNYFIGLETEVRKLLDNYHELESENQDLRKKLSMKVYSEYNSEQPMPEKSNLNGETKPLSDEEPKSTAAQQSNG